MDGSVMFCFLASFPSDWRVDGSVMFCFLASFPSDWHMDGSVMLDCPNSFHEGKPVKLPHLCLVVFP